MTSPTQPRLLIIATVPVTFEAFLAPFGSHFRSLGWRVDGMAAGLPSSFAASSFDRVFDVDWSRNPLDPSNFRRAAPRVRQVVADEGYDLVHVHTPVAAFVSRFALRRLRTRDGVKVVYTAHGFHFAEGLPTLTNAVFVAFEKVAGRWTDELVVINDDDLAAAKRHHLVPASHMRLIHGIGVDVDRFSRERVSEAAVRAVRSELGLDDAPLVLMVAEFTPNKRHDSVLRAFARTSSGVHLAFAGEGPTYEASRRLAEELGIADRTHFLGYRTDVEVLLAASVATVLFSAREGLPRSSMESMAMGVPVVGARIRGLSDLLSDGCGVLVPDHDETALAQAIDGIVENPGLASEMGRRGRRKMEGEYSIGAVLAEHERLYAEVLARVRTA